MLCLKCGQEYNGASCPRCDGPVVLVNNTDYLARKKAYEEKQAKLKESASFDKKRGSNETERKPNVKNVENNDNSKKNKAESRRQKIRKKRRRELIIKLILFGVISVLVLAAAGIGIYKLATRKNLIIYMSYNGKIYNVSGLESSFVCNENDAVFTIDKTSFYQPAWPDGIDRDKVIQSLSSEKGRYYSCVTYSEADNDYELWIWNEDFSLSEKNSSYMELMYLSDDGQIIYTSSTKINEEGSIGNHSLIYGKVVSAKNKTYTLSTNIIEDDLRKVCVYSKQNKIIFLSKKDVLKVYDYKKNDTTVIHEQTDGFLSLDRSHGYVSNSGYVNDSSQSDSFYYVSDNRYYKCMLDDYSTGYIAETNGSNVSFYEDNKNKHIYMISNGAIYDISVDKDGKTAEPQLISHIGAQLNICFLHQNDKLLFVDSANQFVELHKGEITIIEKGITDGTLGIIENSSNYLCYIKEKRLYFKKSVNSEPIQVLSNQSFAQTGGISLYKNRLYYYDSNNILHSCSLKGKDENSIGNVDRFWIGSQ